MIQAIRCEYVHSVLEEYLASELIGLSEGRVSQLFRSALTKLKKLYLFGVIQSQWL